MGHLPSLIRSQSSPTLASHKGLQSQSRGWAADSNPRSTPIPPACRGRPIPIARCARDLAANLSLQVDCVCLGCLVPTAGPGVVTPQGLGPTPAQGGWTPPRELTPTAGGGGVHQSFKSAPPPPSDLRRLFPREKLRKSITSYQAYFVTNRPPAPPDPCERHLKAKPRTLYA